MLLAIRIVLQKQKRHTMQLQKQMRHTMQLQANQPMTAGICGALELLPSAATLHQGIKHLVLEMRVDLK
jgi:hypothetical protein